MRHFSAFFRQVLHGAFPLAKSVKGQHGAQTQTCVCRNLNHNKCSRRRAMGVGTQESIRRRATVVGTMLVRATLNRVLIVRCVSSLVCPFQRLCHVFGPRFAPFV